MKSMSTYHLVYELLSEGKGGLYPELEPINVQDIISELSRRAKLQFTASRNEVIDWCIECSELTEKEKKSIETMLRIKNIEDKALKKLKDEKE